MDKIEELSLKLNQLIINEPVVQEFKKYEQLLENNVDLKKQQQEIKNLQKKIVQQKSKQDQDVEQTIALYRKRKEAFENHPIVVNYLYLKEEVDELLQTINSQINGLIQ